MQNNKIGWYFLSCIFLFEGISSFFGYKVYFKYSGGWKNVEYDYSLYITIAGLLIGYYAYSLKDKKIEYTICPKCKESFNFHELKDGKCKYCEDVDTIDANKYYIEHPEELES